VDTEGPGEMEGERGKRNSDRAQRTPEMKRTKGSLSRGSSIEATGASVAHNLRDWGGEERVFSVFLCDPFVHRTLWICALVILIVASMCGAA